MGRWRAKLVTTAVIYGAGFLTAVYMLAPVPEEQHLNASEKEALKKALDRQRVLQSLNKGLHKAVNLGKETAGRMAVTIREQVNEASTTLKEGS